MELTLLKITEGLPGKDGTVIWHRFIKKSAAEIKRMKAEHEGKAQLREQRRKEQEQNIARKKGQLAGEEPSMADDDEMVDEGAVEDEEAGSDWDDEEEVSEEEATEEEDDTSEEDE
ncbi:hypothetical protein FRC14_002848 [Serendipita sp. 396]|nr:hypothetical protein FRC14_002848 [Serendipita sp. 396]